MNNVVEYCVIVNSLKIWERESAIRQIDLVDEFKKEINDLVISLSEVEDSVDFAIVSVFYNGDCYVATIGNGIEQMIDNSHKKVLSDFVKLL